jgi:topoisomerase IV subunit B
VLARKEVHDIAVALGVDPGSPTSPACATARCASWPTPTPTALHIATLLCALFVRHFRRWSRPAGCTWPCRRCTASTSARRSSTPSTSSEKKGVLDRSRPRSCKGKVNVQRFKGLGEMNPLQLRETVMAPDTRRLVRLTLEPGDGTDQMMDMLLAKEGGPPTAAVG